MQKIMIIDLKVPSQTTPMTSSKCITSNKQLRISLSIIISSKIRIVQIKGALLIKAKLDQLLILEVLMISISR
jgi:hypothetical protein